MKKKNCKTAVELIFIFWYAVWCCGNGGSADQRGK